VIQFVFDNEELIQLLQQRGMALKYLQFEKVKDIEK